MDERLLIYDDILRNKSIVKELQKSDQIPSRLELASINYYSYRDVNDKLKTLYKIKELSVENDHFDTEISEMISTYEAGLASLNNSDYIYILSHMNDYQLIDKNLFKYSNYYDCDHDVNIFNKLDDAINFADRRCNIFRIHAVNKSNTDTKFILSYGRMEDRKIHLYQIMLPDSPSYDIELQSMPYKEDMHLGYYLPFMDEPKYIGDAFNINAPSDSGHYYGTINNCNTHVWNNIGYTTLNGKGSIAVYDFICATVISSNL